MSQTFKITAKMANIHAFNLLKDYYVQRSISLDTTLDSIQHVLKSDYDMDEWTDLTYCLVMDRASWRDVEACFMRELGMGEHGMFLFKLLHCWSEFTTPGNALDNQESVSTMLGGQVSTSGACLSHICLYNY